MSRAAHWQSTYILHKLPKCLKCKIEFQLVTARYEDDNGKYLIVDEWECPRCGKIVKKDRLKEEPLTEQDKRLHNWCMNEQRRRKKERNKNK